MKVKAGGKERNIRSIWYEGGRIKFIDQCLLPYKFKIAECRSYRSVVRALRNMSIRGAPSIGVTAAYALAISYIHKDNIEKVKNALSSTRPTGHDLFHGIEIVENAVRDGKNPIECAEEFANRIVNECKRIGVVGERLIGDGEQILTHCNAGALATVDWGTALSPIRCAEYNNKTNFIYVDETRPRLQGAKLTTWELYNEDIPHALIVDNAAGYYMRKREIDLVIVGADRIAMNGDFANKIGTYEKAVLARENGIPFYAAAPMSTFDPMIKTGDEIVIEERSEREVLEVNDKPIAPKKTTAKNPAFDITPNIYVTGFITEKGVIKPQDIEKMWNK